jgi:preprotein translocase subunit SecG
VATAASPVVKFMARTPGFLAGFFLDLALGLRMVASGFEASNVQIAGVLSRAVQFRALVFVDIAK